MVDPHATVGDGAPAAEEAAGSERLRPDPLATAPVGTVAAADGHGGLSGLLQLHWGQRPANAFRVFREAGRIFRSAHGIDRAASIAYFALLSLVPFMVVGASVLGYVLVPLVGDKSTQAFDVLVEPILRFLPFLRGELALRLREMVEARAMTGILGVPALIVSAALVFNALGRGVGAIFHSRARPRRLLRSRLLSLGFLPTLVVLLALGSYLLTVARAFAARVPDASWAARLGATQVLSFGMTMAVLACGFFLIVFWFGTRRVRAAHLLAGAACFCSCWAVAHQAFLFYLSRIASFSLIYGSISTLMILVVWVYYGAVVLLLSCALTEALRRRRRAATTPITEAP